MGFGKTNSNLQYWNIMMGHITRKVNADTVGAVKRMNKNGDDVWETLENDYTGTLTGFNVVEKKFGEVMELTFDGSVQISIGAYSQYGRALLLRLPKLDLNKEFKLTPYDFTPDGGKRQVGISLEQSGDKITPYWTKDNPGNKPDWESKEGTGKDKGKTIWNNDKEMEYLFEVTHKKFEGFSPTVVEPTAEAVTETEAVNEPEVEDDLPF